MMEFERLFRTDDAVIRIDSATIGVQKVEKFLVKNNIDPRRIVSWSYAGSGGGKIALGYIGSEMPNMQERIGRVLMSDAPAIVSWDRFEGVDLVTVFNSGAIMPAIFLRSTELLRKVGGGIERFDAMAPVTDISQLRQYLYCDRRLVCMNPKGTLGIAMARHDRENRRILALGVNKFGKATRIVTMGLDELIQSPSLACEIENWKVLEESACGQLWFSRPKTIGRRTRIAVTLETAAVRNIDIGEDSGRWDGDARKQFRYHVGVMDGSRIDASFSIMNGWMCVHLNPINLEAL